MSILKVSNDLISDVLSLEPSKSDRTKIVIVEAAIKNYVTVGIEMATFEKIAQTSKLSRPLVQRYFRDREDIFKLAVKFIRANFQRLAVQAIQRQTGPAKQLEAYVGSTFDWINHHRDHARVWLLFFYYCSFKSDYRTVHSELTEMGQKRIEALISNGKKDGLFRFKDTSCSAKMIQAIITGALATVLTENMTLDADKFKKSVIEECLQVVGYK